MSRGLGPLQRLALSLAADAVNAETGFTRWVTVDDILAARATVNVDEGDPRGLSSTLSERESVRRAMRNLHQRGLVQMGDVSSRRPTAHVVYRRPVRRWVLAVRLNPSKAQRVAEARERLEAWEQAARMSHTAAAYDRAIEARDELERIEAS